MRTLFVSALLILACGCADSSSRPSGADASPRIPGGPDPVVLRVSRSGGIVSAYPYPGLDSVIWRATSRVPALERIVAFGADDGYLAAFDARHAPVRIDLRIGATAASRDTGNIAVSSYDGAAIYTLKSDGTITRFTTSGDTWNIKPTLPVAALFAVSDGSLIVAGASGKKAIVWRVRPPGDEVVDTLTFDVGGNEADNRAIMAATAGSTGDRVFFGVNTSVIAVRSRDMYRLLELDLDDPVVAIEPTPSGDRLFVALHNDRSLRVVDRSEGRVRGKIKLPTTVRALRMDPLGRTLLAQGAADTVYAISLADAALQATLQSEWRPDLPQVFADGTVAVVRGDDLVITTVSSAPTERVITDGAKDFWYGFRWNGFRPRAAGLDQPVEFRTSAPRDPSDLADVRTDSSQDARARLNMDLALPPADTALVFGTPRTDSMMAQQQFMVSFAAVQSEQRARDLASRIRVDGKAPRITSSESNGTTLYRVVMGPYPTRVAADRVGKASGHSFWIFEGVP